MRRSHLEGHVITVLIDGAGFEPNVVFVIIIVVEDIGVVLIVVGVHVAVVMLSVGTLFTILVVVVVGW